MEEVYQYCSKDQPKVKELQQDMIEIRLFKKSCYYKAIEQAALIGDEVLMKEESSDKFDLDSEEGQKICKNYLGCLERFFDIL